MPQTVGAGNARTAGLRTTFLQTYYRHYDGIKPELEKISQMGLPSDKDVETYFHWKSTPHIRRWIRGTGVPSKAFNGVQYTATNYEWARSVPWHFADEQDDQTGSLPTAVKQLAQDGGLLDERVFFQIMAAGTDNELLATVPTAPDGQAFFSTTNDGTTARFGITNGNSLTGTGTSEAQIRTDYHTAMAQFRGLLDTESQPLWDPSVIDGGAIIFHAANATLRERFAAVFKREVVHSVISSTGAGVTNEIREENVQVRSTSRLTGNSWYIFLVKAPQKSLFSQERMSPIEIQETWDNSDITRRTGIKEFGVVLRRGYGLAEPYQGIKVTNS